MNASQNRELLKRQAYAVCKALNLSGGKVTVDAVTTNGVPMRGEATLVLCLPVFGVPGRHALECRFHRASLTKDMAVNECRESLRSYLTTHGLTAGLEALRVTA